ILDGVPGTPMPGWRPLLTPTLWVMVDRNLGMLYGALPIAMVGLYSTEAEVAYFGQGEGVEVAHRMAPLS
ncbi:MAG: hypothetical protein AAB339_05970, partial [Elusimicrobiota bacterium]